MRYSEEIIQEVIERNNIVDVIGQHLPLRRTGSNYVGLCPFHNEKTPSFSVSGNKQMYYCFGCHAGGNVITFMMQYNNFTFQEAVQALAERAGMQLPEAEESPSKRAYEDKKASLLEIEKKAAAFYYYRLHDKAGERGLHYLTTRGLTKETIRKFGLGFSDSFGDTLYRYLKEEKYPDSLLKESGLFLFDEKKGVSDKFWNRVMFPIMDARGRVIGFGGRVMGDGKPKYLNSPEGPLFNKRRHLYALNYARQTRENFFILCEGYMDVITMHQAGFTNAVASLGTALTGEQAALIRRFTREVLLLYDSDQAGTMAAMRAAPILREEGISSRVVRLDPYKDPDEFIKAEGAEAFRERLDKAQNAFLFETDQLEKAYRMDDPAQRTAFQHELAARLLVFTEPMERNNYMEAAASRYHLKRQDLESLTSSIALTGTASASFGKPKKNEDGAPKEKVSGTPSERLLLAFLASYPEAAGQISGLISAGDFTEGLTRDLAHLLLKQAGSGQIREAEVISHFKDEESERECARIFHTTIPVQSQAELDRAFTDTVMRVMDGGNKRGMEEFTGDDPKLFQRFIERRKLLDEFRTGRRTLHLTYVKEN
jgi:DNA primase